MLTFKSGKISPENLDLGLSTEIWQHGLYPHVAFVTWGLAGAGASPQAAVLQLPWLLQPLYALIYLPGQAE